jgi:excisionase family DNA binding protein
MTLDNDKSSTDEESLAVSPDRAGYLMGGISADTVRRWCKRGFLRSIKVGRLRLIPRAELERLLAEAKPAA